MLVLLQRYKIGGGENSKVYLEQNKELAEEIKHKLLVKRGLIAAPEGTTAPDEAPLIDEETEK